MKIQFIKPAASWGFGYVQGAEIDCSKAFGKEMIELGLAVEIEEGDTDIPHDFPGRKTLEDNGFTSLAEVRKIADPETLQEITGIGKGLSARIIEWFEKEGK